MDGAGAEESGLRVSGRLLIPESELAVSYAKSGGPGGQHVNKVESKVILRFDVRASQALGDARRTLLLQRLASRLTTGGVLVLHASRHRERRRNEEDARERLCTILRKALETPRKRKKTRPTRASKERRLSSKRRHSEKKRGRGGAYDA